MGKINFTEQMRIFSFISIKNAFLDEDDGKSIEAKQLTVSVTLALITATISLVCSLFIAPKSVIFVCSLLAILMIFIAFGLNSYLFHEKDGKISKYVLSYMLILASMFVYVRGGGFGGLGTGWMIFCVAFTAFSLVGKGRIITFVIESVLFFVTVRVLIIHPEWAGEIEQRANQQLSVISVIITSLYIFLVICFQKRIANIENMKLKQLTEQLNMALDSQRLFTASMNHELRAPLNGVMGCMQMLSTAENLTEDQRLIVSTAHRSADSLVHIVNDLLDYAKIEAGEFEIINDDFDFKEVVDGGTRLLINLIREKGLTMNICIPENMPCGLYGDGARIHQILMNILSNAVKYTQRGSITLEAAVENDVLQFAVSDTGEGISDEALSVIFIPYKRINEKSHKKIQGTGLGMYITNQLVTKMKGSIDIKTEVGKGSVFTVRIPVKITNPELLYNSVRVAKRKPVDERFSKLRMIYVDDSKVNLTMFEKVIGSITHANITVVSTGQEMLEHLKNEEYDIIFIDHQMPIMDGIETHRRIKEMGIDKPCIIFTANSGQEYEDLYREEGFTAFLGKPIRVDEVMACIGKMFASGSENTTFQK